MKKNQKPLNGVDLGIFSQAAKNLDLSYRDVEAPAHPPVSPKSLNSSFSASEPLNPTQSTLSLLQSTAGEQRSLQSSVIMVILQPDVRVINSSTR